ncbi:MAG: mechanosensitive ion channel family protein [Bacteroidota bacterium]
MSPLARLAVAGIALMAAPCAAQAPDPAPADSLVVDSLAVDSLAIQVADSVAAQVDEAAVEALTDTTTTVAEMLGEGVDVDLLGRTLFQVWGGLGDLSLAERATRLSARLGDLAQRREIAPDSLRLVAGREFTLLQAGDLIVMSVTEADARGLAQSRSEAAAFYRAEVIEGVERYREQATLRGLLRSAVLTVVLFFVLLLALRGLGRLFAWLDTRTAAARRLFMRPIRIRTFEVVSQDQVRRLGRGLAGGVRLGVSLVLVYIFLTTVFGLFPWTQTWSENLLDAALSPLRSLGAMLLASIDNVIAILVTVVVVRYVIRLSDYFFAQIARGDLEFAGFHAELADPTRKIVKFFLIVVGLVLIYPYTPIAESIAFQGLTVFFGLLISLGSSSAISNMVAGVVLTYTRAFRVGDRVKVGDTFGDVVEKTFLVTRIRTPKNEDISVPNATVLSNHIVNYSVMAREGSGVVLHTTITIGYDVPWPDVHRLLLQAARDTDGLEAEPRPFVLQTSLGDFSVAYQLNAYTREVTRMARLYSDIHQHIQDRFAEAGVEVLSPTYEAHRDGPSTVPDVEAVQNAFARAQATARSGDTDGADAPPPPEETALLEAEPPPFVSPASGDGASGDGASGDGSDSEARA